VDDFTLAFLFSNIPRVPLLIVCLIGVALALGHSRTSRGTATLAGTGFGFLLLSSGIGMGSQYFAMTRAVELSAVETARTFAMLAWGGTLATTVGLVLLMIAIFGRPARPATSEDR
jgi:hypothetical protein